MKNLFFAIALMMGVMNASAQETTGDLYHGLTRKMAYDRMIPPHGIEVTYDKTVCAHKGA